MASRWPSSWPLPRSARSASPGSPLVSTANFELLPTPQRGRDERHRTVRAAIDWSYDQLDEPERVVFERLSVFAGRFELDAVEQVVNVGDVGRDTAEVLASLVDKSMVVADGIGVARFRMLEPLRQYAKRWAGPAERRTPSRGPWSAGHAEGGHAADRQFCGFRGWVR